MIHPTAVVHPKAELDPSVDVGPYAVIDAAVVVGPRCQIGPHVFLTGVTRIGEGNQFHAGCVIGDAPQDLKYKGEATGLEIGDGNVFREHVTIHRSNRLSEPTVIGAHNFFMAHSHVGHNCHLGDHIIMANGVLLGGHVVVEDRAFLSGNCLVHQFVRIGTLSLMQGGAAVSKDLPPFTVARGANGICGLNTIGLRRAEISSAERLEIRRLYHALFCSRQKLQVALAAARGSVQGSNARKLVDFVSASKRGLCRDVRVASRRASSAEDDASPIVA